MNFDHFRRPIAAPLADGSSGQQILRCGPKSFGTIHEHRDVRNLVAKMISNEKHEANRNNAKRSTGPKSGPGKAIARLNAVTHGAFAFQRLLPGEDATEYEQLSARIYAEAKPKTAIESMIVDQIVADTWRLKRIERAVFAYFEQVRRAGFARTLQSLNLEEWRAALTIIDDEEQLYLAREKHWVSGFGQRVHPSEQPGGGTEGEGPSPSDQEVIMKITRRKLDESRDLGMLLLEGMASPDHAFPYTALENMRRTLERDIDRKTDKLLDIQERRQTLELGQTELTER